MHEMTKKRRKIKKGKLTKSKKQKVIDSILKPNALGANKNKEIINKFTSFVIKYNKSDFKEILPILLKNSIIRSHTNAFTNTFSDMGNEPVFSTINTSKLISFHETIFNLESTNLNRFVEYNETFDNLFWLGRYSDADKCLEECRAELGDTIWYIRNKFIILESQNKMEELRDKYLDLKNQSSQKLFTYLIDRCFVITQSQDATLVIDKAVINRIKEMDDGGPHVLSALLALLHLPDPIYDYKNLINCMYHMQAFNIYDQYLLLNKLFYSVLCKNNSHKDENEVKTSERNQETTQEIIKYFGNISKVISDKRLDNLEEYIHGTTRHKVSSAGEILVRNYIKGDYAEVINHFSSKFIEFKNPLAYINIVSKSNAYLHRNTPVQVPKKIKELIELFTDVYLLNDASTQSIRLIKSFICSLVPS